MDNSIKTFQEARTNPPKVTLGGSSNAAAFLCVLCNWLLSIPYQSYCGDRACHGCIKLLAQTLKQNGRESVKCPRCGEDMIPDQFFPDKAATRELKTLHVACPNEGCTWEGQYCDYEDHFNKCPQLRVKCAYEQCKEMVLRKNMNKHTKKCGFRSSRCEYCGTETTFNHLQDHWRHCRQLLKLPMSCSGRGDEGPKGLGAEAHAHTIVCSPVTCCREKLERSLPIEDLLTQLQERHVLTVFECEEIRFCPNHIEKNRKFLQYFLQKDEQIALGETLNLLTQQQYKSYSYLGEMLTDLFHSQGSYDSRSQHAVADICALQSTCCNGVYIWKVPELTRKRRDAVRGKTISLYSPPFYTSHPGYKMCLHVYLNGDGSGRGTHISFFICLMKGEFDPLLPWPFKQTVSLSLLVQDGVSRDITQSFKPDADSSSFQMPKSEMNVASGCPQFCSLAVLDNSSYARNDTIYLKGAINIQGIEHIS